MEKWTRLSRAYVFAVKASGPGVDQGKDVRDHSRSMAGFDGEDVRLAVLRRNISFELKIPRPSLVSGPQLLHGPQNSRS